MVIIEMKEVDEIKKGKIMNVNLVQYNIMGLYRVLTAVIDF